MARRTTSSRPAISVLEDLPVHERTLDNGLRVLVLPVRHSSIVVSDLYYPVGSYDEPPGQTGVAHFLEHMLFKGTERFPKGQIDRLVLLAGGQSNAETSEDSTRYWFAFPRQRWELAVAIEADRMRGTRFDPDEIEIERRVIAEERARELGSPLGRLDQTHLAVTYLRHPYRNPILGWPEDIAHITAADLKAFYETHYRPDGAVMVVVGDVDPAKALDTISASFADVPAGPAPRPRPTIVEPDQAGRRAFVVSDSESAVRGLFGWRTVPRGHRDIPALDILADLLCGGRRSRLWQALVENDKSATWIETANAAANRAGQFFIQLEAASDSDIAKIENRIAKLLLDLAASGPNRDELNRSRRRIKAAWRWEKDDLTSLAGSLGAAALWRDWRDWVVELRTALVVDQAEIQRVVETYFSPDNLTVGWSLPAPIGSDSKPAIVLPRRRPPALATPLLPSPAPAVPIAARKKRTRNPDAGLVGRIPWGATAGISRLDDYQPKRVVLDNGMRLITDRRPGSGVVALELWLDAGLLREAKPGLAYLTGRLLEEGTEKRSGRELAEAIEDVGGTFECGSTGTSVRVCLEDLALAVDILADVTTRPAFPANALSWVRDRISAELCADLEDPAFRADLSFRELVYGSHPLGRDPRGIARDITRLSRADVLEHHRRYFVPQNAVLVAVGDFDLRRLMSLVNARFGSWTPGNKAAGPLPPVAGPGHARTRRIHRAGEQVHIVVGHLGIPRRHPDFDALVILDHIFGSGPGFCDRLGRIVRDELGLVYTIAGGMTDSADVLPGLFRVSAGTLPEQADRVIGTIVEQIRAMYAGAFSDDEVDRARRYLTGGWVFDFQSLEQRAERLLELERWGLGLDDALHWPDRIAAITPRDVRQAARRHLRPNALYRVELGPPRRRVRGNSAECA